MNDKVQIDATENGKSLKRLVQHLVIWPKSTENMKVIDSRFSDLLTRLSRLLSFFWWILNEILNI